MSFNIFSDRVFDCCQRVPRGRVTTYGYLARAAGSPRAYRAVGNVLNRNKKLIKIPCHRVVKSNGEVGGYARGQRQKVKLLRQEGVQVCGGRVDFNKFLFKF